VIGSIYAPKANVNVQNTILAGQIVANNLTLQSSDVRYFTNQVLFNTDSVRGKGPTVDLNGLLPGGRECDFRSGNANV
jgi:hypothetical protein